MAPLSAPIPYRISLNSGRFPRQFGAATLFCHPPAGASHRA